MALLTTREVAKILRVTPPSVRKIIRSGNLRAVDVGGQKRIDTASLAEFLQRSTNMKAQNENAVLVS